jgi:S-adenosyl methyltransferase
MEVGGQEVKTSMASEDWSWLDEGDSWVPPAIDLTKPSIARIYDYGLGGKDNYAIDREVADAFMQIVPDTRDAARANRVFLTEVVEEMARSGIRQFLDLGTGIPTSPNVHETARAIVPDARVVYVDNDPFVLAHNRAAMHDDSRSAVLAHDLRQPADVLDDPASRAVLDLGEPVGLLMIAVLHFVEAAVTPVIVQRYLRDLAPGSQLAISALSSDGVPEETLRLTESAYQSSPNRLVYRTRAELEALFDGLELRRPVGDVYRSTSVTVLGGLGVKP